MVNNSPLSWLTVTVNSPELSVVVGGIQLATVVGNPGSVKLSISSGVSVQLAGSLSVRI